eukprot:scaffold10591_cov112-Amphora_coffeaeformis.AAC.1
MVAVTVPTFRIDTQKNMAKKKRQRQQEPDDDQDEEDPVVSAEEDDEEEDAEMKEDEEEEEESDEDEEEKEEEQVEEEQTPIASSPFMDAFYGLAATDPRERAVAAQTILWHIQQHSADAAYAWKRLLRGLGSGRAAARQGNAAALAALLKMGMQTDLLANLQKEKQSADEAKDTSLLDFVRTCLLEATQPPSGKKHKGSDERDALFGRLFGITAVIRSGVLRQADDLAPWLQDLAQLYRTKHWMREPAAHAVCLMLLQVGQENVSSLLIEVIVPEFLENPDHQLKGAASPLAAYSAEQVALALFIQHLAGNDELDSLPSPWSQSLLTVENIPTLAPILASTSHVSQPRTHLVWDVLAMILTESDNDAESGAVDQRTLKQTSILTTLFPAVLQKHLLGLGDAEKRSGKATDDRRALALCLVRQWAGVEFVSSLAGRTVLNLPTDTLGSVVLAPPLVQRLLVELVGTKDHYLKPLASRVLLQLMERAMTSVDVRTVVMRSLLTTTARFDGQTKTTTVATLLGWQADDQTPLEGLKPVWEAMLEFCQENIQNVKSVKDESSLTSYEGIGLVDLLFHHGKFLVGLVHDKEKTAPDCVATMLKQIERFFVTAAFFDTTSVKSKKNKSTFIITAAKNKTLLPYELRCVLSARYYSLVTEQVTAQLHASGLVDAVAVVQSCLDDWHALVRAGSKSLGESDNMEESPEGEDESPEKLVGHLQELTKKFAGKPQKGKESFVVSANLLSSLLYLHLLNCGVPDNQYEDDDPDVDNADDREEVESFMQDVHEIVEQFEKLSEGMDTDDEESNNPLTDLASLCVNILSSPLASGSHLRGASPKMLREAVRQFWTQGMIAASQADIKAGPVLLSVLLDALGAKAEDMGDAPEENDADEESEDMDEDDEDNEGMVFSKAAMADVDTEMNDDVDESDSGSKHGSEEEAKDENDEIEVDQDKLQSLLEEDDDASVDGGELEHHAGADAALAKLIQLKQDARKAGQKAKEKIELSNHVRCVVLIETLLMGKPDGWGSLLSPGLILSSLIPLLERRRSLERDLSKLTVKGHDTTVGEKRALLDRITSLLRQRLLKIKVASYSWSPEADPKELALELAQILFKQAKERNSKDQSSLVGTSLVFVTKALPELDEKVSVAKEIYSSAVEEWSSKRASRLEPKIFEDLIQQAPDLSGSILPKPLANAAAGGKTPFLKTEAFRLLSLLFNPKLHASESEELTDMIDAVDNVLSACTTALNDTEMKKAKRAREVLKTLERLTEFMDAAKCTATKSKVDEVKTALKTIGLDSDSQGLKSLVDKVLPRFENIKSADVEEDSKAEDKKSKKSKKKKGKKNR